MTDSAMAQGITSVSRGPVGRAEPMWQQLLGLMQAQRKPGKPSAAACFVAAIWPSGRDPDGFTRHWRQHNQQKQHNTAMFDDDLILRDQTVEPDTVDPPSQDWNAIESLIADMFPLEADLMASIQQLERSSEDAQDQRRTVCLDPIIDAQRQSEQQATCLLGCVKFPANQPAALMIIDAEP